jgi:hypothetical protein
MLTIDFADCGYGLIVVVGKIVGVDVDVVGLWIVDEANGFDVAETFEEGFADTVHAVHDAAVAGENDGMGKVAIIDEAGVNDDVATGELFGAFVAPVGFVELANFGEGYAFSREGAGEFDETVDVPDVEAVG